MRSDRRTGWLFTAALLWSAASLWGRLARRVAMASVVTPDRLRRAGLLALAAILLASPLAAQEESSDRIQIVVPRPDRALAGIARYDAGGRRDPFMPLFSEASGGGSAPRLEMLRLTGVFEGSGSNGLVVLEDPSHRGHFVRLGEQIGNARLVEILPLAAVFEVRDYGASRRVVLRLERTGESR